MQVFFDSLAKIGKFAKENRLTLQKLGESVAFLVILTAINNIDNSSNSCGRVFCRRYSLPL